MVSANKAADAIKNFNKALNDLGKTDSEKECERIRRFQVFAGRYFPESAKKYMLEGGFSGKRHQHITIPHILEGLQTTPTQ